MLREEKRISAWINFYLICYDLESIYNGEGKEKCFDNFGLRSFEKSLIN